MGRYYYLIIKNRIKKIERTKRRLKLRNKNINYNRSHLFETATNAQKVFRENVFYSKTSVKKENCATIKIPNSFSCINNPNETINVLKKINYIFEKTTVTSLFLDYSSCEELGLDASLLTDLLVMNGKKYRTGKKNNINISGNLPHSYTAKEIFYNSGLLKHLKLTNVEDPKVERLDPFSLSKDITDATNETISYYNNCLQRYGYTLNPNGIDYFNKLIGEIIGNADEHSGKNGDWYVSGHFSQGINSDYGKGSLVFLSIGTSIYENLKYNLKSNEIRDKLNSHLKYHKSLFDVHWNEETSITVFGLQYKISSQKDSYHPDRGTGTIKFIDSFTNLGKNMNGDIPKMSILSGKTHILFDGTYTLKDKVINGKPTPTIAFNKENDLKKKPDPKSVKLIKEKFPGVVISVDFYVDKSYLEYKKGGNKNEANQTK